MENTLEFNSLIELIKTLNTEEKCHMYLANLRWNGKLICSNDKCTNINYEYYYIKTRNTLKCKTCGTHHSIKKGTIFENTKIPLLTWFSSLYLYAAHKRAINASTLANILGVTTKTAHYLLRKIRILTQHDNENIKLDGIVEIDEVYCGAKKNRDKKLSFRIYTAKEIRIARDAEGKNEKKNRLEREQKHFERTGKKIEHLYSDEEIQNMLDSNTFDFMSDPYLRQRHYQMVHYRMNFIGMTERNIYEEQIVKGKVKIVLVKRGRLALAKIGRHGGDVNEMNALPILKKYIKTSAHVITDKHSAYKNLHKHFQKYSTIKHSAPKNESVNYVEVDEETGISTHTNSIENCWNQLKKVENGVYVHFSYEYAIHYLNEFVFRWNHMDETTNEKFQVLLGRGIEMTISKATLMEKDDSYFYIAK